MDNLKNKLTNEAESQPSCLGAVITRYSFQEIEKILNSQIDYMIQCVNDSQGTIDPSEDIAEIETTLKVLRKVYNV
jgi:hypothetical protein